MNGFPANVSLAEAKRGLEDMVKAAERGAKVEYSYLIGALDLVGFSTAGVLAPQQGMVFFESGVGHTGCGFTRPIRYSESTFDGNHNMLPSEFAFWAHALGFILPPTLPLPLKDALLAHGSLRQRKSSSDIWEMGSPMWWPAGEFGNTSPSVATAVPVAVIQFGRNGAVGMTNLPRGGELYFTALSKLHFELQTYEPINLTSDGEDPTGENELDHAIVHFALKGYKFQRDRKSVV
jgi:hypothetical protein